MKLPTLPRRLGALALAVVVLGAIAYSMSGPGAGNALRGAARDLARAPEAPEPARPEVRDGPQEGGLSNEGFAARPDAAQGARVALAGGDHAVEETSTWVTQRFELSAGWNTIYLEVDPVNGSPLVEAVVEGERAPGEDPILVPQLSTMEWAFAPISDVLESVWTWNTRGTSMDFIVHPNEGLWDASGWLKYFPESSAGPDGESRAFLTDLVSLHAHRGYLVHLDDAVAGSIVLEVVGVPRVGRPPRGTGEYNLFGFPIHPAAEPDLATFVDPLPIDEVHTLLADGTWDPLWTRAEGYSGGAVDLRYGEAYLIRVPDEAAPETLFTLNALLDIDTGVADRLEFGSGDTRRAAGGVREQIVRVKSRSGVSATLSMRVITGTPPVHLYYDDQQDLSAVPSHALELGGDETKELAFNVRTAEQDEDASAILEIASADLGTRWLLPVAAFSGLHEGLWVGDVTVNEVSEGRLGSTNLQPEAGELPMLTFGLRPRNDSQLRGAVTLAERATGVTSTLDIAIVLDLPEADAQTIPEPETVTAPVVAGHVFEDRRANGEKDLGDPGFDNLVVQLVNGGTTITTPTRTDGSWLVHEPDGLTAGTWNLSLIDDAIPAALFEYTRTFDVVLPQTEVEDEDGSAPDPVVRANRWPTQVEINPDLEVESVTFLDHTGAITVIQRADFLIDSVTRDPVPPSLDFGYAQLYLASLYEGSCNDRDPVVPAFEQVPVIGGFLSLTGTLGIDNASLNEGVSQDPDPVEVLADDYVIYLERRGGANEDANGVACGELTVGKPTIVDGRGSEFEFRVLLRVGDLGGNLAVELLPHYETDPGNEDAVRLSAAAFAMTRPVIHTSTSSSTIEEAAQVGEPIEFDIQIDHRHSLNPFKHKYHPDHDNLDAKFNPIDDADVLPQPHQREVYQYRRQISLELVESVADIPGLSQGLSAEQIMQLDRDLDWKGKTWGGLYSEVIKGIHKHDITVEGHFIIRHIIAGDLEAQSYD